MNRRKRMVEVLVGGWRNGGVGKRRKRNWKRKARRKEEKTDRSIPTWYFSTFPSSILARYR